jgi:uncharacterized protein
MKHKKSLLCLAFALLAGAGLFAYEKNFAPVNDPARILTKAQADGISAKIRELKTATGSEIAVVILAKPGTTDLTTFARDYLEKNKIGRPDYADGIVIAVSYSERKIKIAAGQGLARIVTDDIANVIVDNIMIPEFRVNRYCEGIDGAVNELKKLVSLNKDLIGPTK